MADAIVRAVEAERLAKLTLLMSVPLPARMGVRNL
jgi:hypothetical protein